MDTLIALTILFISWTLLSFRRGWYWGGGYNPLVALNCVLSIFLGVALSLFVAFYPIKISTEEEITDLAKVDFNGKSYVLFQQGRGENKLAENEIGQDVKVYKVVKKSLLGVENPSYELRKP